MIHSHDHGQAHDKRCAHAERSEDYDFRNKQAEFQNSWSSEDVAYWIQQAEKKQHQNRQADHKHDNILTDKHHHSERTYSTENVS